MVTVIIMIPLAVVLLFFVFSAVSVSGETGPNGLEVIYDGDPGADDAMAILMMISGCSKAKLLAITTVNGNTGVVNATRNAQLLLQVANQSDIPVYPGSDQGLVFPMDSERFFGYDGLGDTFTSKPRIESNVHAAIALADIVKQKSGQVTVLVAGALTNIALAIHLHPNFLDEIKEIVILGGSYTGAGNKKPGVEYNVGADPDAARFVFAHVPYNKPVTVVPMEIVKDLTMEWRKSVLGTLGSPFMDFLNIAENKLMAKYEFWFPYDQVAAAVILEPSIILSTKKAFIRVETCGNLARGAFFRDDQSVISNVRFITGINQTLFKEVLLKYMNSTSVTCS